MELSETAHLTVAREAGRDRYWTAEETKRLQRELRFFTAKPTPSDAPAEDGTRGLDLAMLDSLIVQLGPALESLGGLLNAIQVWVGARPQRTVHVKINDSEIDICGATPEESQELIRVFIRSNRAAGGIQSDNKPIDKGNQK